MGSITSSSVVNPSPMNVRGILAYTGTGYFGWQKTVADPTIEQALQSALATVLNEQVQIQAASRTDRGVHANHQVIQFHLDKKISLSQLQYSLNQLLPSNIRLLHLEETTPCFHPSCDAKEKLYHYFICNTQIQMPIHREYSWHCPKQLKIDQIECAANLIREIDDFSFFTTTTPKNSLCHLREISIKPLENSRYLFQIRADRFLHQMVRKIVGTLVYIGLDRIKLNDLLLIINAKDRRQKALTAPSHGLFLEKIFY